MGDLFRDSRARQPRRSLGHVATWDNNTLDQARDARPPCLLCLPRLIGGIAPSRSSHWLIGVVKPVLHRCMIGSGKPSDGLCPASALRGGAPFVAGRAVSSATLRSNTG